MAGARTSEPLYDVVALGMRLYVLASFKLVVIAPERLRMEPRLLVLATHRSEADVPIICGALFFGHDRMYLRHRLRLHFAARDDLFQRGILAGLLPPTVPTPLRRLLFAFDPSPYLPLVRVNPIRGAASMRAVQALRHDLDAPLEAALPPELVERFRRAAQEADRARPVVGREVDRPEFVDLLWREVYADDPPRIRSLWEARARKAAGDLRRLVELVRSGEPLLLFPEGPPSPQGHIGPLRRGVDLLVRRGAPDVLLPLALAFDHFTVGKPRVVLSVGVRRPPPGGEIDDPVLEMLRETMPVTCAQVVAARLTESAETDEETTSPASLEQALAAAVEEAVATGRPIDPPLEAPATRRRRLSECLAALVRKGVLERRDASTLGIDRERALADETVRRAAVEHHSMRGELAVR